MMGSDNKNGYGNNIVNPLICTINIVLIIIINNYIINMLIIIINKSRVP
jgi:hypothetical protein